MGRQKKKTARKTKLENARRRRIIRRQLMPLLYAFLGWFVINTIIHLPGIKGYVNTFFVNFTTHSAYLFGKVLFLPVEMSQVPFLSVNDFTMRVIIECTAYTFYLFGIMLVVFARWPLRHKFISLGIILLGIFIMNNLRFISMGYLGSFRPDLFDLVHDIVWNVLFGFMLFGLWVWREMSSQKARGVKQTM